MSGIVGIVSKKTKNQREIISGMLEIIEHRGNQYKSIITDKNVIIGFQSDLNTMVQNGNIYLFMDGIIYNRCELIKLIPEKCNASLIDEEILLHLYHKYGIKNFELINGDFAIVIWDSSKEILFLMRYISNHKNIYFYQTEHSFIFASEIKSLMKHPEVKREIDIGSVNNFLTFRHIPSPYTVFQNIRRLEAASVIVYKKNTIEKKNLKFFKFNQKTRNAEDIVIPKLLSSFEKSVLRRVNKIEDFGLFLSGGIDSSTILYFLNKFSSEPVRTYTAGLDRDKIYARKISRYFKCEHTEFEISPSSLINIAPKTLWYLEYPMAHAGSFQYYLPKISAKEKYIFWGQGAEELFYGRQDYLILSVVQKAKKAFPDFIWERIRKLYPEIHHKSKFHKLLTLLMAKNPFEMYKAFREILTLKEKKETLNENIILNNSKERLSPFGPLTQDSLLNYSYLTMNNGFLSDTFFNLGQEILNPYMDKDFISLVYSIPSYLKIKRMNIRYLQKKMMKNKLPNFILKRGRDTWHSQTRNWIETKKTIFYYFIERFKKRGIIKLDIHNFFDNYSFRLDEKLWALLTLEILFEIFIDNKKLEEPHVLKDL